MRTALKWYLIVGATILFVLILMSSVTPAISDMALLLNVACKWFDKIYTAGSIVAALVGIAVLDRGGAKK